MKDIHSHVLPGIDDGCKNLDESMQILKHLASLGITELVFTPHYIENSKYVCNNKDKEKLYQLLCTEVKKQDIPIKLYLGNEVYLNKNILSLLEKKEIHTIHNSKYVLIEFPVMNLPYYTKNVLSELIGHGYKIILAHPERYEYVKNDIGILEDLLRMGVLLQGNYESLFGVYGKKSQKILKVLLKKGWIHFLASDIHRETSDHVKKLKKKLRWYLSQAEIESVLESNFDLVIQDKEWT